MISYRRQAAGMGLIGLVGLAIGAHPPGGALQPMAQQPITIAALIQLLHALLLLQLPQLHDLAPIKQRWLGLLCSSGVWLFAGGIYLSHLTSIPYVRQVVPIGGLALLTTWLLLLLLPDASK